MLQPFNRIFRIGERAESEIADEASLLSSSEVVELPIVQIEPNRYQPRAIFNDETISELAQTIEQHGMIQPIIVRKLTEDRYELIAGERRWRAVQMLNWRSIPTIIREMNDNETASVALIENLQREELTVIEEAVAYQRLIELQRLTQEALAQRLGKSQSTIANKLRLLKLPIDVQEALMNKSITERHARALIKVRDEKIQLTLLQEIIEQELNVKQTEERIASLETPVQRQKTKRPLLKGFSKDIRIAMNTIRQSLSMVTNTGVNVETDESENEEYYQITIKIPKKN